ncbi:Glycosyltransferase involved in cell wall bisynthesis [Aquimarina amphilecti]|uniref:Glycosyltransferase involved in cell wall bisynthesis n=1 Tax=Aquimarina amphilecti TaxID=1038014 RepID=A0A1H7HT35_AQUAM|nr:glycosyltransferase family 1 protein [Aquimarina amphilecti]SEK53409.1 Glycosyltransferase involved in cell wall bisynthesis [Aquimarina amphilecti]
MAAIRVLQVFTIMNRGGAESMIMNYYRKVDREKIQFDFLVHRKEKAAFDEEIENLGGKIYRFDPINPLFPGDYYKKLRSFFSEHKEYSIVHSHLNTFSCFPLKIAKEFNIPCRIAHAHIAIDDVSFASLFSNKESKKETFKKLIKLQLKKKVKKDATHLFSCGDKAGKWLFGENNSFTTMNNAIDTAVFSHNKEVAKQYKEEFGLQSRLVIGHVGRFASQKNHAFLLRVFAALLKEKSDCDLVMIGDGPLRKVMEKEANNLGVNDNVHFLGVRADVPELFQMFDVFVFPSFYEGLPVTLIEAQAAGIKVFASDSITTEVSLTNDIEFLSIERPAEYWASKILEVDASKKNNNTEKIIKGDYDIISNTLKIQEFYKEQVGL